MISWELVCLGFIGGNTFVCAWYLQSIYWRLREPN